MSHPLIIPTFLPNVNLRKTIAEDFIAVKDLIERNTDDIINLYDDALGENCPLEVRTSYYIHHSDDPRVISFGIWQNDRLIGHSVIRQNPDLAALFTIAYFVDRDFRNQGIATATCKALKDYVFFTPPCKTIHCTVKETNQASRSVLRKIGFKYSSKNRDIMTYFLDKEPSRT